MVGSWEETHDAVELATLIPLRPAEVVLGLARAELAEVLGGLGHYIGKELELDAAQRLPWWMSVEEEGHVTGPNPVGYRDGCSGGMGGRQTSKSDIEEDAIVDQG